MNNIGKYIIIIAILTIIGFIVWYFMAIIAYILFAAILSLIGHPIVALIGKLKVKKIKVPRAVSAGITLVLLWAMVFGFFSFFLPIITDEAQQLSEINPESIMENLEEPLNVVDEWAKKLNFNPDSSASTQGLVVKQITRFLSVSDVSNIFGTIAGVLGNIFVAFFAISFITFFFLKDEKLFVNGILILIPEKYENSVKHAMSSIKRLLMRYFIGMGIDVCIVITLVTIGLSIVGLKFEHALIIALFVGMVNIIPYVGPIIGMIFGLLFGVLTHIDMDFYTEIFPMLAYMMIVFVSVQILDAALLQPTIYSNSIKAHPLEIFLLILIAGSIAGIPGMILAIPSYTIFRVIAKEFFNEFKLIKKLTQNI